MTVVAIVALERAAPAVPEGRCSECRKLLFRGLLFGEIVCQRCGSLVKFGGIVA